MSFLSDFFGKGDILDIVAGGKGDVLDLFGRAGDREADELAGIQRKRDRLQMGRDAAETLRRSQVERASLQQAAANQGVSDTSAVTGAAGSIQSQTGANLGFANQIFNFNAQAGGRLNKISQLGGLRSLGMTVGSFFIGGIGGAAAGAAGGGSQSVDGSAAHTSISTKAGVF